ncbi:MAG: prolyl oligopeptidase [Betaproteobacteria bacterium]|nr:MAG: prolyl oligopeptidase [Betaproteobacteria bacterium]
MLRFLALTLAALLCLPAARADDDPHLWLEDIDGPRALDWVRARNAEAEREFTADARFEPLRRELLRVLDSDGRIPFVARMGAHYYNFWRDARNPRGVWRRTTLAEYRQAAPAWETVLDLDALAKAEGENWVWKTPECLRPARADEPYRRCLLQLSRGGADAVVVREFDLQDKRFVDGGFVLPEAKSSVSWKDIDTLWVGTDFGPGSMSVAGYPNVAKEWKRGAPLADAQTVFTGQAADIGVAVESEFARSRRVDWVQRWITQRDVERFVLLEGRLVPVDIPRDALPRLFGDRLIVRLRGAWSAGERAYPEGAVLAIDFDAFLRGARNFDVLYTPAPGRALQAIAQTESALLFTELDRVRARLIEAKHDGERWNVRRVPAPDNAQINVAATYWASDEYFVTVQDFTTPTTLYRAEVGLADWSRAERLKSLPAFWNAAGVSVRQLEATSRDGTRVPYFVVARGAPDGARPVLLYGYGGFEIAQRPFYSGVFGKGWLEPGGVFVLANIRGGGEFGPAWHRAALRENRQKSFDDFIAIAEDLIARGIARPERLGIMGGSQGGLLVTGTMVQRPELFGAVVAQVPLTDMLRFHKLLAGASWIGEYGNPDRPADRAFIAKYSPYQNVKKGAKYPPLFLVTSTRDDRVHPGHARKMAARMIEYGHDVRYFENIEGGHGAAANNAQSARMWAQAFTFLWRSLSAE